MACRSASKGHWQATFSARRRRAPRSWPRENRIARRCRCVRRAGLSRSNTSWGMCDRKRLCSRVRYQIRPAPPARIATGTLTFCKRAGRIDLMLKESADRQPRVHRLRHCLQGIERRHEDQPVELPLPASWAATPLPMLKPTAIVAFRLQLVRPRNRKPTAHRRSALQPRAIPSTAHSRDNGRRRRHRRDIARADIPRRPDRSSHCHRSRGSGSSVSISCFGGI